MVGSAAGLGVAGATQGRLAEGDGYVTDWLVARCGQGRAPLQAPHGRGEERFQLRAIDGRQRAVVTPLT